MEKHTKMEVHPLFERFVKELSDTNSMLLAVTLKCHVCLEEGVNAVLNAYFPQALPLKNLQLQAHQKLLLLQSILPTCSKDRLVLVFGGFNALRNKLAHSFDHEKIVSNLQQLVENYERTYGPDLAPPQSLPVNLSEKIQMITAHVLGDLASLELELKAFREKLVNFHESEQRNDGGSTAPLTSDMGDFAEHGFLSKRAEQSVEVFNRERGDWIGFYRKLNSYGHHMLSRCEVKNKDVVQLLALSVFSRALTTFQGALIFIQRGMAAEAKTLGRTLTECAILLAVCARDRDAAIRFIKSDEEERRKRIAGILRHPGLVGGLTPEAVQQLEEQGQVLKAARDSGELQQIPYGSLAQIAKVETLYDVEYRYLSLFSHPSPSGMADDLVRDDAGRIAGVRIGPDYSDTGGTLGIVCFVMLEALTFVCELFALSSSELEDHKRELNAMRSKA
ncbi:DUF5677 domain-containing protein [Verrucomicrobiota bacterium sgz303538]